MQFLAFLKDSLREAVNGWMLQVMLVLAALLILFVGQHRRSGPITLEDDARPAGSRLMTRRIELNKPGVRRLGSPEFGGRELHGRPTRPSRGGRTTRSTTSSRDQTRTPKLEQTRSAGRAGRAAGERRETTSGRGERLTPRDWRSTDAGPGRRRADAKASATRRSKADDGRAAAADEPRYKVTSSGTRSRTRWRGRTRSTSCSPFDAAVRARCRCGDGVYLMETVPGQRRRGVDRAAGRRDHHRRLHPEHAPKGSSTCSCRSRSAGRCCWSTSTSAG